MRSATPRAAHGLPAIDDRLVEPETRYEVRRGELVHVSPADPPHAERHLQLCALIEAHIGMAFEAACDLLTRTTEVDDIAPDVSVYPEAPHPETGGRQLEHLAFEVVSTQGLKDAGDKAADLRARGVRRVFAIDVARSQALEWSAETAGWVALDPGGHIVDPALEVPLPIEAVIHSARADDAVARALIAKRNPVLEAKAERDRAAGVASGRAEGHAEGKAEAVIMVLTARGLTLDHATRAQLLAERDPARLDHWIVRAMTCASAAELLDESVPT